MNPMSQTTRERNRQYTLLGLGALVMLATLVWWEWNALGSSRDTLELAVRQHEQMRIDAEKIRALREAPRAAASRERTNEELLQQVERAMSVAGIDRHRWQDSLPQPPTRESGSPYTRHTTRIYLESIEPRQLAAFAHDLETKDPTLSVSAINLTATKNTPSPAYDAELTVSYLVYSAQSGKKSNG